MVSTTPTYSCVILLKFTISLATVSPFFLCSKLYIEHYNREYLSIITIAEIRKRLTSFFS